MVWFQVWGAPLNLTSVRFEVLGFQSKNRTEPDYGSTTPDCPHQGQTTIHQTGLKDLETCSSSRQITFENHLDTCHPGLVEVRSSSRQRSYRVGVGLGGARPFFLLPNKMNFQQFQPADWLQRLLCLESVQVPGQLTMCTFLYAYMYICLCATLRSIRK